MTEQERAELLELIHSRYTVVRVTMIIIHENYSGLWGSYPITERIILRENGNMDTEIQKVAQHIFATKAGYRHLRIILLRPFSPGKPLTLSYVRLIMESDGTLPREDGLIRRYTDKVMEFDRDTIGGDADGETAD